MFGRLWPVVLDIAHVRDAGGLRRDDREIELDIGLIIIASFKNKKLRLKFPKYNTAISHGFNVNDTRFWRTFEVEIVYRERKFGFRPFFVCPVTGYDCLKLLILDDIICSKPAFRNPAYRHRLSLTDLRWAEARRKLLMEDGSLRMSGLERQRLISIVQNYPERYRSDEAILKIIEGNERDMARARGKALWEAREISTTKGLDCGRGLGQDVAYEEYLLKEVVWPDTILKPMLEPLQRRDEIQNYPELDIKVLLKRQIFENSGVTGRELGWPEHATGQVSIYMFVDRRADWLPRIVFRVSSIVANDIFWQKIDLLPGSKSAKVRYFMCPYSHISCETLYFRNGIFGSREAHNLRKPTNWQPSFPR